MIWNHSLQSLNDFLEHLNTCHTTIKFTSEVSQDSVVFLDTTVLIDDTRKLYTDLYCKPTDSHNYLLYESYHPRHLTKSLPYSQLLRIRRICTKLSDFDKNAILIGKHFLQRNYPEDLITEAIINTRRMNREKLLSPPESSAKTTNLDNTFLVTTFNPDCTPLRDIVQQTWPVLGRTNTTEALFAKKNIFGYRRNKNLRDILVHAKIPSAPTSSDVIKQRNTERQCIAISCRYCPKLDHSGSILCPRSGRTHPTKTNITCNSNNLIYCIRCKTCSKLYVGQTKNSIKERFKCHFYSISHPQKSDTTVGRHFSAQGHNGIDDTQILVLDFITAPQNTLSAQRLRDETEKMWIHKLSTIAPYGLNSAD